MMKDLLTIVIPTASRCIFLNRLLNYMCLAKFNCKIIVADSSHSTDLQTNIHLVKQLSSELNIKHISYPKEFDIYHKSDLATQEVKTPYVVITADDDFLILNALNEAVCLLEKNNDYSAVQGVGLVFNIESGVYYGEIQNINCEHIKAIGHNSASQRLIEHLKNYGATWYSVHRTSQLKVNLKKTIELKLDFRFSELFPSSLSAIQGKCIKIPSLFNIRQSHHIRTSHAQTNYQMHDWIADNHWSSQYNRFREYMAGELAKYDNIAIENALNIVKQAFFYYIITAKTTKSTIKDESISIHKLLTPSHPFHANFLPVHKIIDPFSDRNEWESSYFIQELEQAIQKYKSFPQNYYITVSLRKARKIIANKLINSIPEKIPEFFDNSYIGKSYQLFINSGFKNEPLTKDEEAFVQQFLNDKNISNSLESLKNSLISCLFV